MRKVFSLSCFFLLLLMFTASTAAQEPAEDELIAFVKTAFDNMQTLDSYKIESYQINTQHTTSPNVSSNTGSQKEIIAQIRFHPNHKTYDMYGKVIGTFSYLSGLNSSQEVIQSANYENELIVLDGIFYVRFSGDIEDMTIGWIAAKDYPSLNMLSLQELQTRIGISEFFPRFFDLNTIASVMELQSEIINDREMRVFEITLDMEKLLLEQPETISIPLLPNAENLVKQVASGTTYIQRVWIGAADNFVYRTETKQNTNISFEEGFPIDTLLQEISTSTRYFDFNQSVEIEAPEIGS